MPSKNTKKKMKQSAKSTGKPAEKVKSQNLENQETTVSTEHEIVIAETENNTDSTVLTETENTNKNEKTDKNEKTKTTAKKEKKPSKLKTKIKEVTSELKKVTWPTFGQIVKKTAVVIVVVIIFAIVLFGIDALLNVFYQWLIPATEA